ncbi:hit family protein 1 [Linnemannia elongata]|uniref:Hit family protein 1 n=1 Tax=Linnemannia elongata AG-77 TaxID=1314771 RepID=A0A197K9V4_9FUNG|nr:Adenosine 5'-monophosphoramidase [Linnemannia elongata]OAQ33466.1 hit family protein 1 [Linnemannia elongata AG-77]KAG0062582.1 Adenosine 5'-monophosphoramidase [Linnemannia elongata]KAG0081729.1 Adenosine 5'-monophosphoramidase [Linnemannia elongata]KAH7050746.1 hit family protein 1 [Linnemannia elongata]
MASNPACLFCRIIKREIPSKVLFETEHSLAFLDIGPLSEGHTVVIPKHHAQFLHELPDAEMADLLPTAKKVALAIGCKDYNILQNNGRIAHQVVDHVHFHVIPKPNADEGLVMEWKTKETNGDKLEELRKRILKL